MSWVFSFFGFFFAILNDFMFNIKKIRNKALIFIYIGISVLVLFNYFYLQVINQKKYAIEDANIDPETIEDDIDVNI